MTLTVELKPEAEARWREFAGLHNSTLEQVIATHLEIALMSEDELDEWWDERDAIRLESRLLGDPAERKTLDDLREVLNRRRQEKHEND